MTDYQKVKRPDLAILDVLSACIDPITLTDIHKRVCADTDWVSLGALGTATQQLVSDGLATRSRECSGIMPVYGITCKGRARLIVADTHSIFDNHLKNEPIIATICHAPEVPEGAAAGVALLCVDEDELDAWWNALDVEAKGDAFAQWSLGNDGRNSHVYIEPHDRFSVPIVGTAGETAEEWNAKAARLNERPEAVEPVHVDPRTQDEDDRVADFLHKHGNVIAKAMRNEAPSTQAEEPPNAPMSCDYCGGSSYPFEVHLGEGDKMEAACCLNPGCLDRFHAQFRREVRSAQ